MKRNTTTVLNETSFLILVASAFLVTGCGKEEIKVYSAPKDTLAAAKSVAPQNGISADTAHSPIHWKTPADWKDLEPTDMRVGNFLVTNGEKKAEVSIVPLAGKTGTELGNVNRWRNEIGLGTVSENEVSSEKVSIGEANGKLYDFSSSALQTIAVSFEKDGTSWFFKIRGDKEIVSQNKPIFIEFLKSISFDSAQPAPAVVAEKPVSTNVKKIPNEGSSGEPKWDVPASWQEKSPSAMVLKSFSVGDTDHEAKISITHFPGDVGGALANVNRWRNQLSLEPIVESELSKITASIDVLGGKATLVDMKSTDGKTRLIAASVSRKEQTWFYKLMGDEATVAREKETFEKFVQTVRYPND